jgi:hypothetical protein
LTQDGKAHHHESESFETFGSGTYIYFNSLFNIFSNLKANHMGG